MTDSQDRSDPRLQVLLVEDSLVDAHLLIAILDAEGAYQVTLAQDGMRGTLLATEQDWDLIITDLNLPGDSGLDLIRTAKSHHPTTPILTTTGYSAPKYLHSALREGADDVLMKPIERDDLLRKLLHLLGTARGGESARRRVVALGAEPGDIELGCGGVLCGHRRHGQDVVLVVLQDEGDGASDRALHAAADLLGARVHHWPASGPHDDPEVPEELLSLLAEPGTDTLYVPSVHDGTERRQAAHRIGLGSAPSVHNLYCYQTPSSTTDFHPSLFVDIGDYVDDKLALVSGYQGPEPLNAPFETEMVRSTARYWGRFEGFGTVEPLEVVRSDV
ncbi:MAG: response regulator [Gemmatimonadetes bacterium]|nr:response regulator [Gemmatimonadota bacterium]